MIATSRDERRDDIAVAVAKGHDLVAFDLLVSVESDIVASLFRGCRGAITVDDGHVEQPGLMESRDHGRENDIETAVGLPSAEGAINAGVVDLRMSVRVLFNRQFLPLTSHVQQFQDVIEQDMQGELWRRAPPSNGQVGQDKLPELLEAQFRRN